MRGFLIAALALLLYQRLGEISKRMGGRRGFGRVLRRGARAGVSDSGAVLAVRRARGERIWPRDFGWLVKAAAYQAAGLGLQLRVVLEQPEMVALLKASPQAGRILTPLCRMLAVETSLLRPGVEVVVSAPAAVVSKRVRAPRGEVDWGRIPLSREIVAAARRDGFLKGR